MVATGRTTKNRPPESVSVKGHVILQVDDMMTTRTTKAPPSSFVGKSSPFRNHKFRLLSCMGASLGTALNSRCTSTSSPFIERWVVLQDVHSLFNSEAGQEMERRMQNWAHHMSFLWIRRVRVHSDEY